MGVVVRQSQTEQQRLRAEDFFELVDNRDGAAFAHQDRLAAKRQFQCAQRRPRLAALRRNQIRLRAVAGLNLQPHRRRADFFEIIADDFADFRRTLVRHEAAGDFRARHGGHDGLAAVALIAAGQAVDFKRRTRAAAFHRRETALAGQFRNAEKFLQLALGNRVTRGLLPFQFRERRDVVIKAGNRDAAMIIVDLRQQAGERHRRIFHAAAEDAGVQIARRPAQLDFKRDDAAQRVGERGMFQAGHSGVGNDDGIAEQFAAIFFEKVREAFAADLLLAFDDERQIARQRRAGFEMRFDGLEMREVLAFVVSRAARVNRAACDARLKRRRCPQLQRLRRLHVVMAVNHVMRLAGIFRRAESWQQRWDVPWSGRASRRGRFVGNDSPATPRRRANPFDAAAGRRRWAAGGSRKVRPRSGPGFVSDNRAPIAWPRDYHAEAIFQCAICLQNRSEIILA